MHLQILILIFLAEFDLIGALRSAQKRQTYV